MTDTLCDCPLCTMRKANERLTKERDDLRLLLDTARADSPTGLGALTLVRTALEAREEETTLDAARRLWQERDTYKHGAMAQSEAQQQALRAKAIVEAERDAARKAQDIEANNAADFAKQLAPALRIVEAAQTWLTYLQTHPVPDAPFPTIAVVCEIVNGRKPEP